MTYLFGLIRKTKRAKLSILFGSSNKWFSWKSYATSNAWIRRLFLKQSLSSVDQQGELKCHPEPVKRTMQEEDRGSSHHRHPSHRLLTLLVLSRSIQTAYNRFRESIHLPHLDCSYETSWFTLMMPHWQHKCAQYINFMQASTQCVGNIVFS